MPQFRLVNVPKEAVSVRLNEDPDAARRRMERWADKLHNGKLWAYDDHGVTAYIDRAVEAVADPNNWKDSTFSCPEHLQVSVEAKDAASAGGVLESELFDPGSGNTERVPLFESRAEIEDLIINLPHDYLINPDNWRAEPTPQENK